ncbi:hypothetical protein Mapa_018557 [Marchantia paleacea]|nr:hypothetical protein Mapa_018557 [Marchantia paleacea]
MAGTKTSQLFTSSLAICFTLLPLVAARNIDIHSDPNSVGHRELSATKSVLEPPRGRSAFQVAVPVQISISDQSGVTTDKSKTQEDVEKWATKVMQQMKSNCSSNSTKDTENARFSTIFEGMMKREAALSRAIADIILSGLKSKEYFAKAMECLLKEILKKRQHDEAILKCLEEFLKEMMKNKLNGHYDKEFNKAMEDLMKEIFKKCPKNKMSTATDSDPKSSCYDKCVKS